MGLHAKFRQTDGLRSKIETDDARRDSHLLKAPSSRLQIPNKFQTPILKSDQCDTVPFGHWGFGISASAALDLFITVPVERREGRLVLSRTNPETCGRVANHCGAALFRLVSAFTVPCCTICTATFWHKFSVIGRLFAKRASTRGGTYMTDRFSRPAGIFTCVTSPVRRLPLKRM